MASPKLGALPRPLDEATFAATTARPGQDTRQWISNGIVHNTDPKKVVSFDEEMGCPLVCVTLEPSGHPVHCRVSSAIAGNGEGEWHPFIEGDEVLVALPEGLETSNPVIIGRLNNSYDKFPMDSVAGQDPTTNVFAFRRRRTPFIEEFAGPIMWRTVPSGAFLSLDKQGTVTLRNGEGDALQLSADVFGYQSNDSKAILQMNLTNKQFLLQMGDAYFQISASDASKEVNTLMTPGAFVLATSGNAPAEHVATTESVAAMFAAFLQAFGTILGLVGPAADSALAGIIAAAAGGGLTTFPITLSAIVAAFAAAPQKPPAVGGQMRPGIGCPGFLVG